VAIYKDEKRGTYYVSVYVELNNGDRKRVLRRGFKSRSEAQRAEAEIILNASMVDPDNPLFSDVLDEYMSWYKKRRKESTVNKLKGTIRLYIRPFFGEKFIQDISRRDVMRFHDFLLDKLAVSTSKGVHKDLSAILNYAIQMEYININVAREVGNIDAKDDATVNFWTLDEFKQFLSVVNNQRYRALFMMLFYSGARIGEILALTWEDIDFKNKIIDINKRYYKNKIDDPKTESSIRKIKMPNHTLNMLSQLKLKTKPKKDYVIFGSFYKPLSHPTVSVQFNKYIKLSKVKRIRIHDFRHSHASYLINNGYDIQIVSKRLGHQKVSTTLDIYAHLYPNKEDEAVTQMEDDFKPAEVIKLPK